MTSRDPQSRHQLYLPSTSGDSHPHAQGKLDSTVTKLVVESNHCFRATAQRPTTRRTNRDFRDTAFALKVIAWRSNMIGLSSLPLYATRKCWSGRGGFSPHHQDVPFLTSMARPGRFNCAPWPDSIPATRLSSRCLSETAKGTSAMPPSRVNHPHNSRVLPRRTGQTKIRAQECP